ncbi:hypothetical protein BJ170DRAFT_633715 [Xylariales sp. AK1849]|nr:hypothetical protein BJ170DRAFT_633715 [Xylariales sp. AK1849]
MAKNNKKALAGEGSAQQSTSTDATTSNSTPTATASASGMPTTKKANKNTSTAQAGPSALVICRNKHWRYISSFHGPWLQLPLEVLEAVANNNYYMPLPRPVDPAVFYDLVKIRTLVDEAATLAVRAANGITTSPMTNNNLSGGTANQMQALGLGYNTGGTMKLSPERRFRLREQATQKLSRAYHIDEIASSVATMQGTSALETVASLVLQRAPNDPDANYVHFFHEKIPSRQLAECTDLHALDPIISQRHTDCEPLRTRAIVRMFKNDFKGAVQDFTRALDIYKLQLRPSHVPSYENMQLARKDSRRREMPSLDERDQPCSTEVQLYFQRAGCYLTLACDHVQPSFPKAASHKNGVGHDSAHGKKSQSATDLDARNGDTASPSVEVASPENGSDKKEMEARKLVRVYAKRALRDYMKYLESLHYSPNLSVDVSDEFTRKVNHANHKHRKFSSEGRNGSQDSSSPIGSGFGHTVYSLDRLFAATPPADLPAYPNTDLVSVKSLGSLEPLETIEFVTYHPLLTDALHSLLLCHTLIQTSTKELQRHALMVARLARLVDGYPIFQASRSPARADWIEVLRRAENWIELSWSWEDLCAPAPLYTATSANGGTISAATANAMAKAVTGGPSPVETEEQRKERLKHEAIIEALEDERVNDEASFKAAILARQRRSEAEQASVTNAANGNGKGGSSAVNSPSLSSQKRWAVDDGREYPILTERAEAVARWVREAPAGSGVGGGRRKKKPGTSKAKKADVSNKIAESLDIDGAH